MDNYIVFLNVASNIPSITADTTKIISAQVSKSLGQTDNFPNGNVVVSSLNAVLENVVEGYTLSSVLFGQCELQINTNDGTGLLGGGTYFIDTYYKTGDLLTISCFDRLAFANQPFALELDEDETTYTTTEALDYICDTIGCSRISWSFTSYIWEVDENDTCKDVLSKIASSVGLNFAMNSIGELTLIDPVRSFQTFNLVGKPRTKIADVTITDAKELTKVVVTNGEETFTAGSGADSNTMYIECPVADQDMADLILSNQGGYQQIPFECDKVLCPCNINLNDNVIFDDWGDFQLNVTEITIYFSKAGTYASLGAKSGSGLKSAFAYESPLKKEVKRKVTTGKKYSGTSIGVYGAKSTASNPIAGFSVGADTATEEKTLLIANGEITGTYLLSGNETDTGKFFVDNSDTASPSLNMEMKGLLTTAQDLKGAINELFQSGGSEWKPDEDWLTLPPAESGEITAVVNDVATMQFYLNSINSNPPSVTVNWGDGTVETFNTSGTKTHTYSVGSGHVVSNGTSQFVMKIYNISANSDIEQIHNSIYGGVLLASVNVSLSNMYNVFQSSFELCKIDVLSGTIIPHSFCLQCYSLKIVNLCNGIIEIRDGAFQYCYSLTKININMTSLISIEEEAFAWCHSLYELDLSNTQLTSVPNTMIAQCHRIVKVILPTSIASIGYNACYDCNSLSYINIPAGCTIGSNAFVNCYSLHPIPV